MYRGHDRRLLEAAEGKGHQGLLVHPYRTWPAVISNRAESIGLHGRSGLDVLLPRQGAEVGDSSLAMIDYFEQWRLPVVNRSRAIRVARNQFLTIQSLAKAGVPVLDSVLVNSEGGVAAALALCGGFPVVLKHPSGRQGAGIRLASGP